MDASLVLENVRAAFNGTLLPMAAVLMNEHCEECIRASRRFCDVTGSFMPWESAARQEGASIEAALLTPDAWRYYLPALMTWCVRDADEVDVLVDNLVWELTPPDGERDEWFAPRASGFSIEQQLAIGSFLQWYQEREASQLRSIGIESLSDVSRAIDYWRTAG